MKFFWNDNMISVLVLTSIVEVLLFAEYFQRMFAIYNIIYIIVTECVPAPIFLYPWLSSIIFYHLSCINAEFLKYFC